MSWVKIDDHANEHPKMCSAGPASCWLWACGLMYANRKFEHDGRIPKAVIPILFPGATMRMAQKLVSVGLWEDDGAHFVIHDYHQYQPTKEQVEELSRIRRESGSKGGNASAKAKAEAKQLATKLVSKPSSKIQANLKPDPGSRIPDLNPPGFPPLGDAAAVEVTPEEKRELAVERYRKAYEAGIAKGKGGPFAMPRGQDGELHSALLAHARGGTTGNPLRGDILLQWISAYAESFAQWLAKEDSRMIGIYSAYGPKGFLRWLNEQSTQTARRRA